MSQQPQRADFAHFIRMETRWADLDTLGHVNNANFFTFDESARLAYFGAMFEGDAKFWKDYGIILASIGCDFLAQLHHPATLDIGFRITRIGRTSMQTQAAMFNGEKLIAVSRGVVVWFSYLKQTPLAVPEDLRARIRSRELLKPEEASA